MTATPLVLLGCDPGYRHFGVCIASYDGDTLRVLKRATLKNGSIRAWQSGIPTLLAGLNRFLGDTIPAKAGVEMISWYGRRKGSLQLAHLAGGTLGFLLGRCPARFFTPKEVKLTSASNKTPKGFDEHQQDALSICRLLVNAG